MHVVDETDFMTLSMSRPEALAHWLERKILDAPLEPGTRLGTKEDLRRTHNVAIGTVNEALRILEARGLVRARPGPGGGLFVAAPAPQMQLNRLILDFQRQGPNAVNCQEVRNALEPALVMRAAACGTTEDFDDLAAILEQMSEQRSEPTSYLRHNWALHRRIAEMCDNSVLRALYIALLDFLIGQVRHIDQDADAVVDDGENLELHRQLVAAIVSGDPERAREAAHQHRPSVRIATGENPDEGVAINVGDSASRPEKDQFGIASQLETKGM
jgi:DNA-binding FadR family transcriptional regulator